MTGHFKSAPSNDLCTKCPQGNRDNDDKKTCTCKDGKYPTRGADTRCFGKLATCKVDVKMLFIINYTFIKTSYQCNVIE